MHMHKSRIASDDYGALNFLRGLPSGRTKAFLGGVLRGVLRGTSGPNLDLALKGSIAAHYS